MMKALCRTADQRDEKRMNSRFVIVGFVQLQIGNFVYFTDFMKEVSGMGKMERY